MAIEFSDKYRMQILCKITCLVLMMSVMTICASSQQYNYYHYEVKNGLSGNTVYAIAQDKDGFIWLGTETGLSRFDGFSFKNYSVTDGLNDKEIINLFVDSKNRVWIFPFKNSVYYYYQGKVHNSYNDSLLKKFHIEAEIFKACEDKDGNIIFLEPKKTHVLSANNKLLEFSKIENRDFFNNTVGTTRNGYCVIQTVLLGKNPPDHGVTVYEYKNSKLYFKKIFQDSGYSKNGFEINKNYEVITNGNFFQIKNQKNNEEYALQIPARFHTISYVNDSCFAIATFDKTFLYNINEKKIVDSFLSNKMSNRCFSDNENNFWFATSNDGLYRLSSTKIKTYKLKESYINTPVYSMFFSDNVLYMGGDENLIGKLSLKKDILEIFNFKTNLNIRYISDILVKNNIIFAGSNIGVYRLKDNISFVYLPSISIKNIIVDSNNIITATDRGIFSISFSGNLIDTISTSRATSFYKKKNKYYVGTLNNIYVVEKDNKHALKDLGNIFPILKDKIIKITGAQNGDVWIGTENNGIVCLRNDKVIKHLTIKNGLSSNSCRCLYVDENNIWVGTDKGISKVNFSHYPFKITNYTAADGLDCELINCLYASGDSVYAGTPYGLTFFNAGITQQKSICNLKILNIHSNQANWYFKQDSINLSSNDNFLRFEYTGISFASAGDITFYYQLKGLSDEWQSTRQNQLEFPSLYPGDYELNIYAVNKFGIKSKTTTIHFTKAKHYWQLLWVQIIFFALIAGIIWLIVNARIKAVRRTANENLLLERRINELEQMALKAQMNPHFIFNSINSIQQYVFSGNVAEANEYITNFSSLVRQTLYMSGKKFITLAEEVKYLEAYLAMEQAKYDRCFNFNIITDKNIYDTITLPPLLIQPFVENSIRHGVLNLAEGKGIISVHFYKENNMLCCIVEDNGIGRSNAMRIKKNVHLAYESKGMELVRNRIESLNSLYNVNITVAVEDIVEENATGTRVIIKFPLSYGEQNN